MALAKVPGELFANLQIRHESDLKLELVGCFVAAAVMIGPYGVVHGLIDSFELLFLLPMLLCIPAMFVFMFLTWIERTGIVFFARRRGWRIPASVAAAICACATPGWIAASTLLNVGAALMLVLQKIITDMPPTWQPWMESAAAALPFLGFIAGMLVFETLVYIGVRRCKYANWLTRPDRDQQSGRMDPE